MAAGGFDDGFVIFPDGLEPEGGMNAKTALAAGLHAQACNGIPLETGLSPQARPAH